jgi:hypothetical protein
LLLAIVRKSVYCFCSVSVMQQETSLECASAALLDEWNTHEALGFRAGLFSLLSQ